MSAEEALISDVLASQKWREMETFIERLNERASYDPNAFPVEAAPFRPS